MLQSELWTDLYRFWFWSVSRARPFFLQPTVGLGTPAASQASVTVTVTSERPAAMEGATERREPETGRRVLLLVCTGAPPTVHLQVHSPALRPGPVGRHTQVAPAVGHLGRAHVQRAVLCERVPEEIAAAGQKAQACGGLEARGRSAIFEPSQSRGWNGVRLALQGHPSALQHRHVLRGALSGDVRGNCRRKNRRRVTGIGSPPQSSRNALRTSFIASDRGPQTFLPRPPLEEQRRPSLTAPNKAAPRVPLPVSRSPCPAAGGAGRKRRQVSEGVGTPEASQRSSSSASTTTDTSAAPPEPSMWGGSERDHIQKQM
ncbi:hypothetical protein EYF80_033236 [Liparis tanakae]|uniref:Uncharacterized protein n=1 Tax=Liparis tanakae TaxID=230148 RepID=A0A4Z2GTD3_9TELE|nr:hypothetical protein EYF80_033236 [Liparis tanakae]